jgi:proteic killer suppression protein
VEVLFSSRKLERECSIDATLHKRWGSVGAKKIALRLQQLAAAPTLDEMRSLPGRCHELTGNRAGRLAVDVHQPYRLIFEPTANPRPEKPDGGLDWRSVDSITVLEIIDYH